MVVDKHLIKHIVSVSGGMGSFAESLSCVQKYGKDAVLLLFADTLMEDEDLYRFLQETTSFLGCQLITVCYGKTPWQLFEERRFVGNTMYDLCSRVLKRDLINNWVREHFGLEDSEGNNVLSAEIHIGVDFSEHHRLTRVQNNMAPWVYRSTLVEEGRIIPKDFSEQFGIAKPRLYDMGFSHNNCGGFCVKAGQGHFKILYEQMPERYLQHEEVELRLIESCQTLPFLRKNINGKKTYMTLQEYRQKYLETGKAKEDTFEIGGCGCAL